MPQNAAQHLRGKSAAPIAMSTAQWDMVDAQIRERAFFMAGVDNARILHAFQQIARQIAAGQLSLVEGRQRVREMLMAMGYAPGEDAGSIHDLSSRRRLDVSLETNVQLARGWAERKSSLYNIGEPGQELYRQRKAREPRDWAMRWAEAAAAVDWEGVARDGSYIALKTSPIWVALSRFGQPYPPFDFNSGMRVRGVDDETCERLGLLDGNWMEEQIGAAEEGLNENTEADCRELSPEVLKELDEALGSVGDIVDGVARMTDINGTTPYSAEDIAEVVGRDTPEGVPNVQRTAAEAWADGELPEEGKEAMRTLLERTKPEKGVSELQKTFELPEAQAEQAMQALDKDGYEVPEGELADAWGLNVTPAVHLQQPPLGMVTIQLNWREPKSARNMQPLLDKLGKKPEDALHLIEGKNLRVVDKKEHRTTEGRQITYTLEEQ